MRNVTISMDDELYRKTRIEAAKAGKSMSRFLAEAAKAKIAVDERTAVESKRNSQLEALERIFSGPEWDVSENGRMPTAEERNFRGRQSDIR